MVLMFLMHTISPLPLNILYSQSFENADMREELEAHEQRQLRKEALLKVATQTQEEYALADRHSTNAQADDTSNELFVDATLLSSEKRGIFRLPQDCDYFPGAVILWFASCSVVYAFILKPSENRLLAQNVLDVIVSHLKTHAPLVLQPKETIMKVDRIQAVVNHFLPMGQLLFMTHRITRQFEKELEKYNKT